MKKFYKNNPVLFSLSLVSVLGLSFVGCLKTRAQLRDESVGSRHFGAADSDSSMSGSIAMTPPQDVQPQNGTVLDEIKDEITRIEGRIDELERAQKQLAATPAPSNPVTAVPPELKEQLKTLENRLNQIEQTQSQLSETLSKLQQPAPAAAVRPNELFEKGKTQFKKGEYENAADTFFSYLKHPQANKSEEATYLRAESLYHLKQYKKAIVDYSKFPEKYSKSSRMPDVLYKIGLSFESLGMKEDAIGFYQELIEKYPKSAQAKKAKHKVKV